MVIIARRARNAEMAANVAMPVIAAMENAMQKTIRGIGPVSPAAECRLA